MTDSVTILKKIKKSCVGTAAAVSGGSDDRVSRRQWPCEGGRAMSGAAAAVKGPSGGRSGR